MRSESNYCSGSFVLQTSAFTVFFGLKCWRKLCENAQASIIALAMPSPLEKVLTLKIVCSEDVSSSPGQ